MKTRLLGYRHLNFKNDSGDIIDGTQVFCSFTSEAVEGEETGKFFLKTGVIEAPMLIPGEFYEAGFNSRGKIISFTEL